MRLPIRKGDDGRIAGLEESAAILRHGIERGINYIDTAPGYCHRESETAIGMAIQGLPRESVHLSTKFPVHDGCGRCLRLQLELSLRKMQTEYVDFYHFWGIGWRMFLESIVNENGPLAAARKAKDEGLIRHISFSCHDKPGGVRRLIECGEFESMLIQYNLLDRTAAESLRHAHARGLGTAVMGPVGGGRLGTPSEVFRQATGGSSTAEAALRFVWANPDVDLVLSGMQDGRMVDENAATAERAEPLSQEELARIDALVEQNRELLGLPCTGCGYCTPCPKGVAIPKVFLYYQWYKVFDLKGPARERYAGLGKGWRKEDKPVTECVECGECEPKCPQKIAIMERLKEAHQALAGG
jgi:hypothetical protein